MEFKENREDKQNNGDYSDDAYDKAFYKDFEGLDKVIGDRITKAIVLERLEKDETED